MSNPEVVPVTEPSPSPAPPPSPPVADGLTKQDHGVDQDVSQPMANWDNFDACKSLSINSKPSIKHRKRKSDSISGVLRSWMVNHQIGFSINLIILLALTHICFPRARRRTRTFFELSYHNPSTGTYKQGPDDFYFVAYWIVVLTGLRAGIMNFFLEPLAQHAGITKRKAQIRFAEQAWLFLYYLSFWCLGVYLMYNSDYWLNLRAMWNPVPTPAISGLLKWYYLVQFAFWLQQIVVVNIEERRKDFWQMFTHHIVTCTLLLASYGWYQTKAGNVILCVMDVVDFIFPAAKLFKYTGYQTACDIAFVVFVVVWLVTRHIFYPMITWSVFVDLPERWKHGCYCSVTGQLISSDGGVDIIRNLLQPFLDPGGLVCHNPRIDHTFLALLLFLQAIALLWFVMIVRVAWNVLKGNGADDSRSDDEGELEDEEDEVVEMSVPVRPMEQVVGVEGLNLKRRAGPRPRYKKSGAQRGGLSFAGHSDRKELLGRIGCDKPT